MLDRQIARKINGIRKQKGYTLDNLATFTGLSKGLLSKIENCQVSPPIATLSKISQGLNVPIGIFFNEEDSTDKQGYAVTLKNKRKQVNKKESAAKINYFSLSGFQSDKILEPFLVKFPILKDKPTKLYDHPGEEFLFVLKGRIDFIFGEDTIRLNPGDSIHFDPIIPHMAVNAGKSKSECLIIIAEKGKS
ncbi:MAG: XRE family transcriptional regulator [Thermodesulfobacteriota bacterium]